MNTVGKDNSKKIFKNTAFLTIRMLVVILISLYTARIIINALGVEDFGIFSVVGGLIGFLGVLNGSLVSASQRFLSFELGKQEARNFNGVLNSLLLLFVLIGLLAAVVGLAFKDLLIDHILVFPAQKKDTVEWVYYFALSTFCANLLSIPYMASIVSHEKMAVFAYIGLFEAALKLCTAWALLYIDTDKLFLYGLLNLLVTIFLVCFYFVYNMVGIKETKPRFYWNPTVLKHLYAYTGWSLFGSVTSIFNLNGQAVLLNVFFGPVTNAAKAVADRINSIIASFSNNFYTAVRPQLIKKYAGGDTDGMLNLGYKTTKYSFFIMFIVSLPLIVFMQELLVLWLGAKNVTPEMVLFVKLIIVFSLLNTFEQPVTVMIQATGMVRKYEVVVGMFTLLLLPLSYLAYKLGAPSHASILILIGLYSVAQFFRLQVARSQINLSYAVYMQIVVVPVIRTLFFTLVMILVSSEYMFQNFHFFWGCLICLTISFVSVYMIGLNDEERLFLADILKRKIKNEKKA